METFQLEGEFLSDLQGLDVIAKQNGLVKQVVFGPILQYTGEGTTLVFDTEYNNLTMSTTSQEVFDSLKGLVPHE